MCGIVGYIGDREAFPILLDSLRMVTYRGYDSYGVAVLNGDGISTQKSVGAVDQCSHDAGQIHGTAGIGHTRWATVGAVSGPNAHPHEDCSGQIAIVHNGDIENYRELRAELAAAGHVLKSDTDSEVIAHLIESYESGNILAAVRKATRRLVGSYALVVLHRPTRCLVVARQQSPLVVGLGDSEAFVASDVPALLPYTHQVVYLADGDLGLIGKGGLSVWHDGVEVERPVHVVEWEAGQLTKGGFEHYMLKEIHEQPDAIRHTLGGYANSEQSTLQFKGIIPVRAPDEVLLLGCGTSFHAALVGEQLLTAALGVPVRACVASEYTGVAKARGKGLAIAMTQSGETADTVTAAVRAKAAGYSVLAITNVPESSISRLADGTFYTKAGPEVAVAATKTFTAQLVALEMLAMELAATSRVEAAAIELRRLPNAVEQALMASEAVRSAGKMLASYEKLFIIAKGANIPVAMEGALKFKEVAYLHTEGCPAGELKHGPFALLGAETPVIAIVPSDGDRPRMLNAMREIATRGSRLVALVDGNDEEAAELSDVVIQAPKVGAALQPIVNTVMLQLLSYYCALERGCPIDRPRNLAKSVTVL